MKCFAPIMLVLLLLLAGCTNQTPTKSGASGETTPLPTYTIPSEQIERYLEDEIPLLYCDFESKLISVGTWLLSSNEVVVLDSAVGTTKDPYTLYSIRWDGGKNIAGARAYIQGINRFNGDFLLMYREYGELVTGSISITRSDDGIVLLNNNGEVNDIAVSPIEVNGIDSNSTNLLEGCALLEDGDTLYYLQSIMREEGLFLVCTTIDVKTHAATNQLVSGSPYSINDVDISSFGADTFAVGDGSFYFFLKNKVYSIDPKTLLVTVVISIKDLELASDNPNASFQISGVAVYKDYLIVESAEYVTDIPANKSSHVCDSNGKVLQSISWNPSSELLIFPQIG